MLFAFSDLASYRIIARDGEVGTPADAVYQPRHWRIRHLAVDLDESARRRPVLIPPAAIEEIDRTEKNIRLRLNRQQLLDSPDLDIQKRLSRTAERDLLAHYHLPFYPDAGLQSLSDPGHVSVEALDSLLARMDAADSESREHPFPRLRAMMGETLYADGDKAGTVDDVLISSEDWHIRQIVVHIGRFLTGNRILVAPHWITRPPEEGPGLAVDLTATVLENSPGFDPAILPASESVLDE